MEERVLGGDILSQPVIPQPLAYPDMLEHRSPEGTAIFTLGVDSVPGNWRKKLC